MLTVKNIKCPVIGHKLTRYKTVAQLPLGGVYSGYMHCTACGTTYRVGTKHPLKPQGPFVVRTVRR